MLSGETQKALQPSLKLLKTHGIGAILDYAAEDDVQAEDGPASRSELNDSVVARTFDYDNEAKCEQHTGTFLRNIKAASEAPGQGFAAIKVQFHLSGASAACTDDQVPLQAWAGLAVVKVSLCCHVYCQKMKGCCCQLNAELLGSTHVITNWY